MRAQLSSWSVTNLLRTVWVCCGNSSDVPPTRGCGMPEELGSGCQRVLWPQDPLRCLVLRLFLWDPFLLGHLGFRMLCLPTPTRDSGSQRRVGRDGSRQRSFFPFNIFHMIYFNSDPQLLLGSPHRSTNPSSYSFFIYLLKSKQNTQNENENKIKHKKKKC